MKLTLYSSYLKKIADIGDRYISALWREDYSDLGAFCLELYSSPGLPQKCRPGIFARRTDRPTLMVVQTVEIKNGRIVLTGKSALAMLQDRVFVGSMPSGTKVSDGVYSTYKMSTMYDIMTVDKQDFPEVYDHDIGSSDLWTLDSALCHSADMGLRVIKRDGRAVVQLYKPGPSPRAKFSRYLGNMASETITLSTAGSKNRAAVLGQGEGADRVRVNVAVSDGNPAQEMIVDARDLQQAEGESLDAYKGRLRQRGLEKLAGLTAVKSAAFQPLAAGFGVQYDLGDPVTAVFQDSDLRFTTRIVSFTEKCQNNKSELSIDVGELRLMR